MILCGHDNEWFVFRRIVTEEKMNPVYLVEVNHVSLIKRYILKTLASQPRQSVQHNVMLRCCVYTVSDKKQFLLLTVIWMLGYAIWICLDVLRINILTCTTFTRIIAVRIPYGITNISGDVCVSSKYCKFSNRFVKHFVHSFQSIWLVCMPTT